MSETTLKVENGSSTIRQENASTSFASVEKAAAVGGVNDDKAAVTAVSESADRSAAPQLRKRRSLLEVPPSRRDSTLYNVLSREGDGIVPDDRTQEDLIASPTYAKSFRHPHNNNKDLPLYTIDEVPYYLRDNAYVRRYYRAYYSTKQCLQSLFHLHNETLNIWTHLLGGLVFTVLGVGLFTRVLIPEYKAGNSFVVNVNEAEHVFHLARAKDPQQRTAWPLWIFGFYSFSCLMCMACSTFFHLFLAHMSEHFYGWAHAFDYFGITFLVVGSFLPFCFYVFSCQPEYRNLYLGMICSLGVIGLLGPFYRKWTSTAFATKKTLFYVLFVGSGLFPIAHMCTLPHDVGLPYVRGLLTMMALYGVGVMVYAFKVPEIFFPGVFDVFGSSHQIWHLCVFGAALTHFLNAVKMYNNADQLVCDMEHLPKLR